MAKVKRDEVRENRIVDDIIVDAYGEEEQALDGITILNKNSNSLSWQGVLIKDLRLLC